MVIQKLYGSFKTRLKPAAGTSVCCLRVPLGYFDCLGPESPKCNSCRFKCQWLFYQILKYKETPLTSIIQYFLDFLFLNWTFCIENTLYEYLYTFVLLVYFNWMRLLENTCGQRQPPARKRKLKKFTMKCWFCFCACINWDVWPCRPCVSDQRMIKFLLMVNRQGQTRLSRYYQSVELSRRAQLEADAVRCCLSRRKDQVSEWLWAITVCRSHAGGFRAWRNLWCLISTMKTNRPHNTEVRSLN